MQIEMFTVTPFFENCYVLKHGGETMVVDPGEAAPELKAAVKGEKVTMIFNTHCHCDHSGGNAEMMKLTGAPLVCHEADLPLLRALPQQGMLFGVPVAASPDPDRFVEEGDVIELGGASLKVLHTPGHAPGHVVLVGDGFVIAGDTLFAGSIGRTDLPGGNYQQLITAIREKLMTLPDETVVYSGHGPTTTIGEERRNNPFLNA
jgi:hydroxyacylglutathione hydrolase